MNIVQFPLRYYHNTQLKQEMIEDLNGPQYLNEIGENRLHEAVKADHLVDIKKWCSDYPYLIEMSDSKGNFPIHFVQSLEALQILLEAGAKWGQHNGKGQSVWDVMCQRANNVSPKTYFAFSCLKEMIKTDEFLDLNGLEGRIDQLEYFMCGNDAEKIFWTNLGDIVPLLIEKGLLWQPQDRKKYKFRTYENLVESASFIENLQSGKIPNADSLPNPLFIAILTDSSSVSQFVEKGYKLAKFDHYLPRVQDEKLAWLLAASHETDTEREKVELLRKMCYRLSDLKEPSSQQINEVKDLMRNISNIRKYIQKFDTLVKFIHKWRDLWPQHEHEEIVFYLIDKKSINDTYVKNYLTWFIEQSEAEVVEKLRLRIIQYTEKKGNQNHFAKMKIRYLRACCPSNAKLMVRSIIDALPSEKYRTSYFLEQLSQDEIIEFQKQVYFTDNPSQKVKRLRRKLIHWLGLGYGAFDNNFRQNLILLMKENLKLPEAFEKLPEKCRPFLLPVLLENPPIVEEDPVDLLGKILTFWQGSETVTYIHLSCSDTLVRDVVKKYPNIQFPMETYHDKENLETVINFNQHLAECNKQILKHVLHEKKSHKIKDLVVEFSAVLTDEAFELIPDHSWVSAMFWLVGKFPKIRKDILKIKLTESQSRAFISTAFENPKIFEPVLQALLYTKTLSIRPGGRSHSTFGDFAVLVWNGLAGQSSSCSMFENKFKSVYLNQTEPTPVRQLDFPAAENKTIKIYGRTITWQGPKGEKAIKFRKLTEPVQQLAAEPLAIDLLNQIGCQSILPKPKGIFWVQRTPSWIRDQIPEISPTESQVVYSFLPPKGYYDYPNDSLHLAKKWRKGRKRWLLDTAMAISVGKIKIDLVTLFHNEMFGRKYQILADLIRSDEAFEGNNAGLGAGRLSAPLPAVAFPNVSLATGARDIGDFIPFSILEKNIKLESTDLEDLSDIKRYLPLAARATVILVDALLLVDRIDKQGRLNWRDSSVISELAEDFRQGFIYVLQGSTRRSEEAVSLFANHCSVDWERLAKQLIFWMQATEKGYVGALKNKKLQEGLYPPEVEIEIELQRSKNYDPDRGFRTNGGRDYGCYNGPLGLTELEKLCYITGIFSSTLEHSHEVQSNPFLNNGEAAADRKGLL